MNWRLQAACTGRPELFFGDEAASSPAYQLRTAAAKALCGSCPVLGPCRDFAVSNGIPFGVFGGMTEKERRAIPGAQVTRWCGQYLHVLPEGAPRCHQCDRARERAHRAAQRQEAAA